jgi:hypothetical protein
MILQLFYKTETWCPGVAVQNDQSRLVNPVWAR